MRSAFAADEVAHIPLALHVRQIMMSALAWSFSNSERLLFQAPLTVIKFASPISSKMALESRYLA